MGTLESRLRVSLLDDVSRKARGISAALGTMNRQAASFTAPFRSLAGQVIAFGGAYLGVTEGVRRTAGSALEFESAFADVRKVLNGTDEQLENVRRQIIGMSKELPIAATGIAEIYAAAAQANIPINEISKFSEMVAKVSTAWEVPVAETGQALAEIKNQLNMGVEQVGLFADSLNHLSNNTAANAPRLLEYTKRVAATGEMFGFSAQETLAFGGAMIAAGGESEVAATSFRNMGNALTSGATATKSQRSAFKRLGLDAVKTSKNMQKNAIKTTIDVIDRIANLPEAERISVARMLFGNEARALMPLINNSTELRRQLGLVGDQANYAGSAFKEYVTRADTTGNVLQILNNKVQDVFRSMGDRMLPTIKEAALAFGEVLDSLGERVSIFDRMETAIQGFAQGLGYGGVREVIEDLGDLLFGKVDATAGDHLGRIFAKSKEWGQNIRDLSAAIKENPIAQFFGQLSGYGFEVFKWSLGITAVAVAVRGLAKALWLLSGASAIVGAFKVVKGLAGLLGVAGGTAAATTTGAASAGTAAAVAGGSSWLMRTLGALGAGLAGLGVSQTLGIGSRGTPEQEADIRRRMEERASRYRQEASNGDKYAEEAEAARKEQQGLNVFGGVQDLLNRVQGSLTLPDISYPPKLPRTIGTEAIRLDDASVQSIRQPTGVQEVMVKNPAPNPNINISLGGVHVHGVTDPDAIANQVSSRLTQRLREEMAGLQADMGYRVA